MPSLPTATRNSGAPSNQPSLLPDPPRYRQPYEAHTPGDRPYASGYTDDVKDTQVVSPYDSDSPYRQNGGATFRGRSPSGAGAGFREDEATLSGFLHNVFLTTKQSAGTYLTPSSSDLSLPYLSSFLPASTPPKEPPPPEPAVVQLALPSASTVRFVSLCGLWYISSALSSNTGKNILTRFRYPVTLTFIQFAFVAGYCVVFLAVRERFAPPTGPGMNAARRGSIATAAGWGIRKPSKTMFHGTFIMSLFQIAGHVFSSMAIARVPVSTVHTIKALSPLFTVVSYAALFKVRYSPATYTALIPLTLGVMLACSFDLRANAVGFLCALGSTIIFVSQNIFSKKLLPKESPSSGGATSPAISSLGNGPKLDKLNLLLYSSGMAFVLMIPIWAYSDGSTLLSLWLQQTPPAHSTSTPSPGITSSLAFYFLLNGTVHFAQNLLAFSLLARTSPVTYSIASLIKRIAVICLAIIWSGQSVTLVQGFGMTMTFVGLWLYNRAKGSVDQGERKRTLVEKRNEHILPTSNDEAGGGGGVPPPAPYINSGASYYASNPPPPPQYHAGPPGGGGGGGGTAKALSPILVSSGSEAHEVGHATSRPNRTPSLPNHAAYTTVP